jgi:hypothetical protein
MDITSWWTWVESYEPSLASISMSPVPGIINDAYQEATHSLALLHHYLDHFNYERLVYRFALHRLIVSSGNSSLPQLAALYKSYGIERYAGIIQTAGDGPSSATKLIPKGLQDGDARSLLLWATPYGKEVEAVYEELKNIAIVS